MHIRVRFFASLREEIGIADRVLELQEPATIEDVWHQSTNQSLPENILCARNHTYTDWTTSLMDGDEVAFFPPVTGG